MESFSAILALCAGNSPVSGAFPAQRPVTQNFGVFFDLRLNKRLSKHSRGWWFETLSRPLWRHCYEIWGVDDFPGTAHRSISSHSEAQRGTTRVCDLLWKLRAVLVYCFYYRFWFHYDLYIFRNKSFWILYLESRLENMVFTCHMIVKKVKCILRCTNLLWFYLSQFILCFGFRSAIFFHEWATHLFWCTGSRGFRGNVWYHSRKVSLQWIMLIKSLF